MKTLHKKADINRDKHMTSAKDDSVDVDKTDYSTVSRRFTYKS